MTYQCHDCSYKGKKRSAEGHCPACGSTKYRNAGAGSAKPGERKTHTAPLVLLVLLWGYLITEIYWKLYS